MIDAGPPPPTCRNCGGVRQLVVDDSPEPICRECIAEAVRLADDPHIVWLMTEPPGSPKWL